MHILFDVGGTKTRVAVATDNQINEQTASFNTPQDFNEGVLAIVEAARALSGDGKITAVAGGVRGILDIARTGIAKDPGGALPGWENRSLVKQLSESFAGVPVYIENDTAVVGLGEANCGAGLGHSIVAYHTVSTGFGGARIEHGMISRTAVGFEPGHQIVDIAASIKGGPDAGTIERMISGTALEKRRGVKPYEIDQSDPVWDELASYLARALRNTIVYWSPDVIVLGGSMICGVPGILLEDVIRHTRAVLGDNIPCPAILPATLGDQGGLYGAMTLLKQST